MGGSYSSFSLFCLSQSPQVEELEVRPVFGPGGRLQFIVTSKLTSIRLLIVEVIFTIVRLLSSLLSWVWGIGQKHKKLFLGSGLWESSLVLFTHPLSRFAQPDQRNVTLQVQVNRGNQVNLQLVNGY